jgi:hypothetical protein
MNNVHIRIPASSIKDRKSLPNLILLNKINQKYFIDIF